MPSVQPPTNSRPFGCWPVVVALVALAGLAWIFYGRTAPAPTPAPDVVVERLDAVSSAPEAPPVDVAVAPPVEACEPPCEPGAFCRDGVCHAFTEVSCGALSACDGPAGRQCYDAQSPCDTGFLMTPCQSPGRRECRDGAVVCIPRGRNAGGCAPPTGGVCDENAQCRCPTDRPSSCADWWGQPGARACVDMLTDDAHCGGCDVVCDNGGIARSLCRAGRCACPEGTVACPEEGARATYMRCRAACGDGGARPLDAASDAPIGAVRDGATDAGATDGGVIDAAAGEVGSTPTG